MIEIFVVCALLLLIIVQQAYYGTLVNKLVNKIMSRNYLEYEQGKSIGKEVDKIPLAPDPDVYEDLRTII